LKYKDFDNTKSFIKALKLVRQEKKFRKEIDVLVKLTEDYPKYSIDEIITNILSSNSKLISSVESVSSIIDLLPHFNIWYRSLNKRDSIWKNDIDDIAQKKEAVIAEKDLHKRLQKIEEAFNLTFNCEELNTNELISSFEEDKQILQEEYKEKIEVQKKDADKEIISIKEQAEKDYKALELSKKASDDNYKEKIEIQKQDLKKEIANIKEQAQNDYKALELSKKTSDDNNKLAEKYFANLYDPYIKEFQNEARDFSSTEFTKRLAFIAFNVMDLTKFVNDNWSADIKTEGNIRNIISGESLDTVPKENFDPNTASSYINSVIAFLHKNGVTEVDHLIDGTDINEELKVLNKK
jgi:hypothetical protein